MGAHVNLTPLICSLLHNSLIKILIFPIHKIICSYLIGLSCSSKLLHKTLHHSYQEASTNLVPPTLSNSNVIQQRSLSTNIPLVENYQPTPINVPTAINTNQDSNNNNYYKITSSPSFTRTASKKRREFGKEKRNVSTNVSISHPANDDQETVFYQVKSHVLINYLRINKNMLLFY